VAQIARAPATYLRLVSTSPDECQVNERIDPATLGAGIARAGCYNIYSDEISRDVRGVKTMEPNGLLEPQTTTDPGSLGPALGAADGTGAFSSALEGLFKVELTDAYQQLPPARWDAAANQYRAYKLTLTAFAQLRNVPLTPPTNPWSGSTTTSSSANLQALRVYITTMSN
jgi:hypothetical protein